MPFQPLGERQLMPGWLVRNPRSKRIGHVAVEPGEHDKPRIRGRFVAVRVCGQRRRTKLWSIAGLEVACDDEVDRAIIADSSAMVQPGRDG